MTSGGLRILFVEDSPEDVELEEHALRKGGLRFESIRVETGEALYRALEDFRPTLIISDYTLPTMDGLRALQISRAVRPEAPFIFVSGTIGEERAVDSLKNGATDYVLKDRMGGLCHAVDRALREVREREERRTLEEEVGQESRMDALGRLAGGVAREFNDLLTVIRGYVDLTAEAVREAESRRYLEEATRACERAGTLTRQLVAISRRQYLQARPLDLNALVLGLHGRIRGWMGENVALGGSLDRRLGAIAADPEQIEEVLLNLCVNARAAMSAGGTLLIETSNVELGLDYVRLHPEVSTGPHVMLSVQDTGCGMTGAMLAHLFEPFYPAGGEGLGGSMGLSTVYGIVRQSGGSITVESEPGRGATFRIYFPRIDGPDGSR